MGLDMYLSKKTYVKQWSHNTPEEQFEVTVKKGGEPFENIQSDRISYITESLMYWRKANQIHGWFVNNTNEVTPDVLYRVETQHLEELLETCKKVIEILNNCAMGKTQIQTGWSSGEATFEDIDVYDCVDEISDLLPPTQGFFFGGSEIDEWYKNQVLETIEFLEKELPNCDKYDEFEYYASW